MFEDFYLNLHLAPFYILFFFGFILLTATPIHYMIRKKTLLLNPFSFPKYTKKEMKALLLGAILAFIGIFGIAIISEKYGYYRSVTDIHGNKIIEKSKPLTPPGVLE